MLVKQKLCLCALYQLHNFQYIYFFTQFEFILIQNIELFFLPSLSMVFFSYRVLRKALKGSAGGPQAPLLIATTDDLL